jgi:MoxR-like ATPase
MDKAITENHARSGREIYQRISNNIQKVVKEQSAAIRKLLFVYFCVGTNLEKD